MDVHLHIYESKDPKGYLDRAREVGIEFLITAGEDVKTSMAGIELAEDVGDNMLYAEAGIHPSKALHTTEHDIKEVERLLSREVVVGVGEIGLDAKYERFGVGIDAQRKVFYQMIELAKEYSLPVSVHSGRSYREVVDTLIKYDVPSHLHWYSGDVQTALEAVEVGGFLFSFGPAVLRYKSYAALIEVLPMDAITTETDFPVKIGGRENGPEMVPEIVKKIAEIKGENEDRLAKSLYENAKRFFGVKK